MDPKIVALKKHNRGFTLTELLISVAIFVTAMALIQSGIKLINDLTKQKVRMEAHTEAERALFMIHRDILNARAIISSGTVDDCPTLCVAPQKLQLAVRNYADGFDFNTNSKLFSTDPVDIGTITYEAKLVDNIAVLQRTVDLPGTILHPGGVHNTHAYLKSYLLSATTTFFTAAPNVQEGGNGVEINLPLKPSFWKEGEDRPFKVRYRNLNRL